MKLAIMQPYLFPYLGYFQLIKVVDIFVIHDDVQYIKGGWINRNRILLNHQAHLFSFSIKKAPAHLNINQRNFGDDFVTRKKRFLEKIRFAYCNAPYYSRTMNLIKEILDYQELNVSLFIINSLKRLCMAINILTPFCLSSELNKNQYLKGEQRVIDINKNMGASHYVNPIGGTELYSPAEFARNGIRLNFIQSKLSAYTQFNQGFVPDLSIIDVLMFNSRDMINRLINEYDLV
jgi:hypothetical protein